jgi:hypothetical protein
MSCEACTKAAAEPWHGFRSDCQGCKARSVARSPHFDRVRRAGVLDNRYTSLLAAFGVTHEEVKAAAERDALK